MALFKRDKKPDPVLAALNDLMAFSAQSLEVSREESAATAERMRLLEELVTKYGAALESEKSQNKATVERLNVIEQRLVSMGNELANQMHELGNELERLSSLPGQQVDEGALDTLRTSQARLAQEQARYEIAFRQDLAALADLIQRRNG